jgi:hypothetical protein
MPEDEELASVQRSGLRDPLTAWATATERNDPIRLGEARIRP